ncbi:MAG: hypothetical protein RIQ81_606 [Pseudomonadota bacterium]
MKRVWVLGGLGFIGRHVCEALVAVGHEVLACTTRPAGNDSPFADRAGAGGELLRVVHTPGYRGLAPGPEDVCVHLAESNLAGAQGSALTEGIPYPGGEQVLRQVVEAGFARVIYASSAAVYGDRVQGALTEDSPTEPASEYGRSKVRSEAFLRENAAATILRLANTYGPGMSPRNVLSEVIEQARKGPVIHVNDASPVRDYIFVADVARAFAAAVSSDASGVFNISTGIGTSVEDLAKLIGRLGGHPAPKVISRAAYEPSIPPSHVVLSSKLAADLLKWRATTALADGLNLLQKEKGS